MAPPTGIEPAAFCSTGRHHSQVITRALRDEGAVVRRGGVSPPQPVATGLQPAGLVACPSRRISTSLLACHAYSVFKVLPGCPGKKKGAWRSPGPLLTPWVSRGNSSCSHEGGSKPDVARMGSCRDTRDVSIGHLGVGRQPQQAVPLRRPRSSKGLWPSQPGQHIEVVGDLSR